MNLKDKRARRITAACASAAVVTAGGVVLGVNASATESLGFGPNANSATITNLDVTASTTNAETAYGLKVTGATATDADPLRVSVLTGPSVTNAGVFARRAAGNATPAANTTATQLQTGGAVLITGTGTAGTKALTLSAANASDISGSTIRIGTGATAQWAVVVSGGAGTSLVLDRKLTADVSAVAVYSMAAGANFLNTRVGQSAPVVAYDLTTNSDSIYLGATIPGTYTLQFYKDRNGNETYDAGQDAATPAFTLNVKDVNGTTTDTTDDLKPTVSVASSTGLGQTIKPKVTTGLTHTDTRGLNGGSPNVGVLGAKIAAASNIAFAGPTGIGVGGAPTFDGTTLYRTSGTITDDNASATSTYTIGSAISVAASTSVNDNNVSAVELGATDVTGSVMAQPVRNGATVRTASAAGGNTTLTLSGAAGSSLTGHRLKISKAGEVTEYVTVAGGGTGPGLTTAANVAHAHSGATVTDMSNVAVKTGTASVTYTVSVTDGDTDKSNNSVYFTLGGTDVASLTTNGTTVDATNHIYEAKTNNSGVASLTVTNNATTRTGYTVTANSNNVASPTLTATYADAQATSVAITSSDAALAPNVTATTVPVSGKLLDQFGAHFQPSNAGNLQIAVSGAATGNATIANGAFTYNYAPASTPTAGSQDNLTFSYTGGLNPTKVATVSWASSTNVNAVAITAPVSTDTPAVQVFSGISTGVTVTGTVTDSGNTGLAYKTVTLTGDQGVYFSTSSTGTSLVNSLDVTTNGSGTFTAYAFYTKTGNAKITATSGSKSSQVTVAVQKPGNTERYMVSLNDVSALPGSTVVVSGKVVDVFGNPVPGVTPAQLTLTGDTVSLGVLGTQSTTNNGGEFSATFIAGSTPGKVYLSAEIWGGVQQSPDAGWLTTGGLTLPKSNSVATATLTIAPDSVSLNASSASVVGAKGITLSGTTRPNTAVDVYLKNTGAPLALIDSVTSGNDGKFSVPVTVTRNSTFVAKTATATSSAVTVKVTSTATISSSIRKGKLRVTVAGGPSRSGTVQLWERLRGGKLVEVGKPVYTRYGAVTWTFKASNGTRIFRAQYTASGSQPSAIVSTQVTQLAPRRR